MTYEHCHCSVICDSNRLETSQVATYRKLVWKDQDILLGRTSADQYV